MGCLEIAFLKKRGDIWHIYRGQDGKKHGKSLCAQHKRVAEEYLKRSEYELSQKQFGQRPGIALQQLEDECLSYSKAKKKQSSCGRRGPPRVSRFVESHPQRLIGEPAASSVKHCMDAASGLPAFAVGRGCLSANVVTNVRKVKAPKNTPRCLSSGEW